MKNIFTQKVVDSGLLNSSPHIFIYPKIDSIMIDRILTIHPGIYRNKNEIICGVSGGFLDVDLHHKFEAICSMYDIRVSQVCGSVIKTVFAFGYKERLDQVPSNWNVSGIVEFPNGIPDLLSTYEEEIPFILCSESLLAKIKNIHGASDER